MKKRILMAAVLVGFCVAVADANAASHNNGKSTPRPSHNRSRSTASFRKPVRPITAYPPRPVICCGGFQTRTTNPGVRWTSVNVRQGTSKGVAKANLPPLKTPVEKTASYVSAKSTRAGTMAPRPAPMLGNRLSLNDRGLVQDLTGGNGPSWSPPSWSPPPAPTVPNIISAAQGAAQVVQSNGQNGINYVGARLPSLGGSGVSFGPSSQAGHAVSGMTNGQVLGTSAPPVSISRPTIQVDNGISTATIRPPTLSQAFGGNQPVTPHTPTLSQIFGGNQPKVPQLPTLSQVFGGNQPNLGHSTSQSGGNGGSGGYSSGGRDGGPSGNGPNASGNDDSPGQDGTGTGTGTGTSSDDGVAEPQQVTGTFLRDANAPQKPTRK